MSITGPAVGCRKPSIFCSANEGAPLWAGNTLVILTSENGGTQTIGSILPLEGAWQMREEGTDTGGRRHLSFKSKSAMLFRSEIAL